MNSAQLMCTGFVFITKYEFVLLRNMKLFCYEPSRSCMRVRVYVRVRVYKCCGGTVMMNGHVRFYVFLLAAQAHNFRTRRFKNFGFSMNDCYEVDDLY